MKGFRRREEGLLVRAVEEEVLILDSTTDRIHQLNATAGFIWRHLDSGLSTSELGQLLADHFDVGQSVATSDVETALDDLAKAGLVERVDENQKMEVN